MTMPQVFNCGYPGSTAAEALTRFDTEVAPLQPTVLICYFGYNDALNAKKLVSPETFTAHVRSIIHCGREAGARKVALVTHGDIVEAYLAERQESHPHLGALRAWLDEYVATIREMAATEDCLLADFRKYCDSKGLEATNAPDSIVRCEANDGGHDGLHLTPTGYQHLATCVWDAIEAHVLPDDRIVCFGDSVTHGVHVVGAGTTQGETYPARLQELAAGRSNPA